MRCQHKRHVEQLLRKKPRHRHIPRMRMHNVDRCKRRHLRQVQAERFKRGLVLPFRAVRNLRPRLSSTHVEISLVQKLLAPAVDLNLDRLRQLPAKVLNVNASTPVNIGGILPCHQTNSQASLLVRSQLIAQPNRDTSYATALSITKSQIVAAFVTPKHFNGVQNPAASLASVPARVQEQLLVHQARYQSHGGRNPQARSSTDARLPSPDR